MSALEVLDHLREANPKELTIVRDTAESLLSVAQLTVSEDREIVAALEESEAQFARGKASQLLKPGGGWAFETILRRNFSAWPS